MTSKEKALELITLFKPHVYCYMGSGMLSNEYDEGVAFRNAKECALKTVQEIFIVLQRPWVKVVGKEESFWKEVKEELLKMKYE